MPSELEADRFHTDMTSSLLDAQRYTKSKILKRMIFRLFMGTGGVMTRNTK